VDTGATVSTFYDPMLAKIVAKGADRDDALRSLRDALGETEILGVRTNLAFLRAVLDEPLVREGRVTTDWLERAFADWRTPRDAGRAANAAARAEIDLIASRTARDPWGSLVAWRPNGGRESRIVLHSGDEEYAVRFAEA